MADDLTSRLPHCGLFRTTQPLPAHDAQVPATALVYFHNHSDSGLPQVVLPDHSVHNTWHFHGPGIPFRALSWAATLQSLPAQGFYVLQSVLVFEGERWPRRTLIQLDYSRSAQPVAFLARQRPTAVDLALYFPDRGVPLRSDQLSLLHGPLHVFSETAADGYHPADLSHPPSPATTPTTRDPNTTVALNPLVASTLLPR